MATTPIDRLIFAQGGLCFFCRAPLQRADASIEHLVAKANGGGNGDDNCVVCCKSLNRLLGSLSLKEKMQIILNQRGDFRCPNKQPPERTSSKSAPPARPTPQDQDLRRVIANLQQRKGHPRTLKTLTSTIVSLRIPREKAEHLVQNLVKLGIVKVSGTKVEYEFAHIGA